MKCILSIALLLAVSAATAAVNPAFVCKSSDNDTVTLIKQSGDTMLVVAVGNGPATITSTVAYEPGTPIVSVVAPDLKMSFDRISGLGTMKMDGRFSQIDCK